MNILITSGGTVAPIDDVRHVGNVSSGRFGSQIALAAMKLGHIVTYLHSKGGQRPDHFTFDLRRNFREQMADLLKAASIPPFISPELYGYESVEFKTYEDYVARLRDGVHKRSPAMIFLAAAVSDYAPLPRHGKISSNEDNLSIRMMKLPKVIKAVKEWMPSTCLIGFKLLSGSNESSRHEAASKQIEEAGSDIVVVNDIEEIRHNKHTLYVFSRRRGNALEATIAGNDLADRLFAVCEAIKSSETK